MIHQGSKDDPIYIKSEEEQQLQLQNKLQYKRNKILIDQAIMTGNSFEIITALVKTKIQGSTLQKQQLYQKELNKYYQSTIGINIASQFFAPFMKGTCNLQQQPIKNEFILYGVDFMASDMIRKRFSFGGVIVKQIRWINDSHCRIVFKDEQDGRSMLEYQLFDNDEIKKLNGDDNQYRRIYKLKSYQICKFIRPLFIRYAFPQDINLPKNTEQGQYYKFQQIYFKLEQYLINKYELQEKYYEIIQKMNRDLFRKKRRNNEIRDRSREMKITGYEQQQKKFDQYIRQRDNRAEQKIIKTLQRKDTNKVEHLNEKLQLSFELIVANSPSNHEIVQVNKGHQENLNNSFFLQNCKTNNTPLQDTGPKPKIRALSQEKSLDLSINPKSSIKLQSSKLSSLQISILHKPAVNEPIIPKKTTINEFQQYLSKQTQLQIPTSIPNKQPNPINTPYIPTIVIDDEDDIYVRSMICDIQKNINPFLAINKEQKIKNDNFKKDSYTKKPIQQKRINLLDLDFVPRSNVYEEVLEQIQIRKKIKELEQKKKKKEDPLISIEKNTHIGSQQNSNLQSENNMTTNQPNSISRANNFINKSNQSQIDENSKASNQIIQKKDNMTSLNTTSNIKPRQTAMKTTKNTNYNSTILNLQPNNNFAHFEDADSY